MADFSVTIKGLPELRRDFAGSETQFTAAVRDGLLRGAAIVASDAQRTVHSPSNPWTGRKDGKRPTGKLQSSVVIGRVSGHGLDQSVPVGVPGIGVRAFGRSTSQRSKRTGRQLATRKNKSDPRVYGPIEERLHPFLVPSLRDNADRIVREVLGRVETVLRSFG